MTRSRTGAPGPLSETVISPEVIAAIGAHAAAATTGVIRMETSAARLLADLSRTARQRFAGISPAPVTGTTATVVGGQASIRVEVAVSGDRQAAETAAEVQRSVARAVTGSTGLPVAAVAVAILDISLGIQSSAQRRTGRNVARDDRDRAGGDRAGTGPSGAGALPAEKEAADGEESRAQVCEAVLRAVRSVPGLCPASPVRPERARWMPWDPAILAVGLADEHLEVQLAATQLPLPPLLEQAAAAIRAAAAPTRWAALPHRLVVAALDASALTEPGTFPPGVTNLPAGA